TGAGNGAKQGTAGLAINNSGTVAGFYIDKNGVYHGYVRTSAGVITTFDVTGAGTGAKQGTVPLGINNAGTIVGNYFDSAGKSHGFLRSSAGVITTFDVTGALLTSAVAINTGGTITGYSA